MDKRVYLRLPGTTITIAKTKYNTNLGILYRIKFNDRSKTYHSTSLMTFHRLLKCTFQNKIYRLSYTSWQQTVKHYSDVRMSAMVSQITDVTLVYSTVCSGADQRKHQSSASLAFVRGIHRWPVNFPHKGPVTRKMFPFDDVILKHVLNKRLYRHLSSNSFLLRTSKD